MSAYYAQATQAAHVCTNVTENAALPRAQVHASSADALKSRRSMSTGRLGFARLQDNDPTAAACDGPVRRDRCRSPGGRRRRRSRSRGRNRHAAHKGEADSVENQHPNHVNDAKGVVVQKPVQPLREFNSLAARPSQRESKSSAAGAGQSENGGIYKYYGPCNPSVAPPASGGAARDGSEARRRRRSRSRGRSRERRSEQRNNDGVGDRQRAEGGHNHLKPDSGRVVYHSDANSFVQQRESVVAQQVAARNHPTASAPSATCWASTGHGSTAASGMVVRALERSGAVYGQTKAQGGIQQPAAMHVKLHKEPNCTDRSANRDADGGVYKYYGPCDAKVAPEASGGAHANCSEPRRRRRSRSRGRSRERRSEQRNLDYADHDTRADGTHGHSTTARPTGTATRPIVSAACASSATNSTTNIAAGCTIVAGVSTHVLERFRLPQAVPTVDPTPVHETPANAATLVDEVAVMLSNLKLGAAVEPSTHTLPENCLSLEEYLTAAEKGELVYKGKGTVEEKYSEGWVFNISTRRWVRLVKSAELAATAKVEEKMSELQSQLADVFDLLKRRKEEEEAKTKEEASIQVKPTAQPPMKLDLACVVVDTNVLLDDLHIVDDWLRVVERIGTSVKILVPRAVMLELDGLNHNRQLVSERAHKVRSAVRFMSQFPGLIQADNEVFRDDTHHAEPYRLRGDDAILNCCLYFSQTLGARVTLVTRDKLFRVRAINNGIHVQDPFYLNVHEL